MSVGHFSNIFCLSWSMSGELLLSGGNDGQVILHSVGEGTASDAFTFPHAVHSAEFLCDSERIFVVCGKRHVEFRDTRDPDSSTTGSVIGESSRRLFINARNHPQDSNVVAVANRHNDGIAVYDLRNPNQPVVGQLLNADLTGIAWNPNGTQLAAIGYKSAYVGEIGADFTQFTHPDYLNKATIKNICWVGTDIIAAGSNFGRVHLWNTKESTSGTVLNGHRSVVNTVDYSPVVGTIASSGVENTVRLWSEYRQEPFKGCRLEKSLCKFSQSEREWGERGDAIEHYQQVVFDETDETNAIYQDDEDMIAYFEAMHDDEMNDEFFEIATIDESSSSSSSTDSSGTLEPLNSADIEKIARQDMFQNAREAHIIRRQLESLQGGAAVPASLLSSSDSDTDSTETRKAEMRQRNAKRSTKKCRRVIESDDDS